MITSILSGVLGSLTGIIGHWFKAKEEKEKREFELKKVSLEMDRDKLNSELRLKEIEAGVMVEESRLEGNLLIEESKGFNQAVMEINKNKLNNSTLDKLIDGNWFKQLFGITLAFLLGVTDVVRGLIRPTLTIASFIVLGYVLHTFTLGYENLTIQQQASLISVSIDAIIYVLTASVQFWYMDRHGARDFRKKH